MTRGKSKPKSPAVKHLLMTLGAAAVTLALLAMAGRPGSLLKTAALQNQDQPNYIPRENENFLYYILEQCSLCANTTGDENAPLPPECDVDNLPLNSPVPSPTPLKFSSSHKTSLLSYLNPARLSRYLSARTWYGWPETEADCEQDHQACYERAAVTSRFVEIYGLLKMFKGAKGCVDIQRVTAKNADELTALERELNDAIDLARREATSSINPALYERKIDQATALELILRQEDGLPGSGGVIKVSAHGDCSLIHKAAPFDTNIANTEWDFLFPMGQKRTGVEYFPKGPIGRGAGFRGDLYQEGVNYRRIHYLDTKLSSLGQKYMKELEGLSIVGDKSLRVCATGGATAVAGVYAAGPLEEMFRWACNADLNSCYSSIGSEKIMPPSAGMNAPNITSPECMPPVYDMIDPISGMCYRYRMTSHGYVKDPDYEPFQAKEPAGEYPYYDFCQNENELFPNSCLPHIDYDNLPLAFPLIDSSILPSLIPSPTPTVETFSY